MNETSILKYSNLIQMKREYLNIRIWNEWNEYTWIFEFETNETSILEYSNLKRMKQVYSNIQIWSKWNEYSRIFEFETNDGVY